jgi:hypothetical protein
MDKQWDRRAVGQTGSGTGRGKNKMPSRMCRAAGAIGWMITTVRADTDASERPERNRTGTDRVFIFLVASKTKARSSAS